MTFALGTATGRIEIEYDGSGVKKAEDDIGGLTKKSGNVNAAMRDVSNTTGAAGLAIAAGLALAVNAAADFEQRMSAVQAVSGANARELELLSDKALQLGADTAFSAGESALAMEELVKAGLTVEEVLNGAADATVALAAAGEVDMATAASIASAAMNSFSLEAEDAARVADLFAGAANASATDVTALGESFKYVAPLAAATGVSIDDTVTALAAMADVGITGSQAGTTLRAMLQNLQPASDKAAKSMKELGFITKENGNEFYNANGSIKSMAEISGTLAKGLEGLSDKQKSQALSTIFGARAMAGATALALKGEAGFKKLDKVVTGTSASEVAATRLDNMRGSLEELGGSVETLAIVVGSILLPALRSLVDNLTAAFNWFGSLSDSQQKMIVVALAAVAAILLIVTAVMKIIIFVNKFRTALVALRTAMAATWLAALGPIALVIAAIAIIIAIIVLLWKKNETFRNVVLAVWSAIKSAVSAVADWFMNSLVPGLQSAWDAIVNGVKWVGDLIDSIWNGIKDGIGAVMGAIGAVISMYITVWRTIIETALNIILAVWNAVWGTFGGIITAVFDLIVAIITLAWVIIKGLVLLGLMGIKVIFTTIWNAISAVVRGGFQIIMAIVRVGMAVIKSVITTVWNVIKSVTSAVWNAISGVIKSVWGTISGVVSSAANRIKSLLSAVWNVIKSLASKAWQALVDLIGDKVLAAYEKVQSIKDKILDFFKGAGEWLVDAGKDIIQGLIDGIEAMIGKVTDKIKSVTDKIGGFLPGSPVKEGALKALNQGHAGKEIIQMLVDGMVANQTVVEQTAGGVAGMIADPIAAPPSGGGGRIRSRGGSIGPGRSRIVDGELRLDQSGRAFISALAEDEVDDGDDYDDTLDRMGRG